MINKDDYRVLPGFNMRLEMFKDDILKAGLTLDQFVFLYEKLSVIKDLFVWSEIHDFYGCIKYNSIREEK